MYKIILFYLLFTAIQFDIFSESLDALQLRISDNVVIYNSESNRNLSVLLFKDLSCLIHFYRPTNQDTYKLFLSKSSKFFICLNCQFAYWTNYKLLKAIEKVPWFYQNQFKSKYEAMSKTEIENIIENLECVSRITKRFGNILLNFIDRYTYTSLLETSFVKALFSLNFHAKSIVEIYSHEKHFNKTTLEKNQFNDVMITGILETINAIQTFIAFNCDMMDRYHNKHFHGISINEFYPNDNPISELLLDIKEDIQIETPLELCDAGHMLLEKILLSESIVSSELSKLKVYIDKNLVTVSQILEKVKRVRNLETVFWYQTIVFTAIVKTICVKIKNVISTLPFLYSEVKQGFEILLKFFFPNFTNLPNELVYYFRLLATKQDFAPYEINNMSNAIENFLNKKEDVVGKTLKFPICEIVIPADAQSESSHNLVGLQDFVSDIVNNVDDYKCFMRLFGFLSNEYTKYYMFPPFNSDKVNNFVNKEMRENNKENKITKPSTSKSPPFTEVAVEHENDTEKEIIDVGCKFFINLYQYYFENSITLKNAREKFYETSPSYLEVIADNIYSISRNLKSLSSMYRDRTIDRITFNLVAIAEVLGSRIYDHAEYDSITRLISVGKAELNTYGLEYCKPPSYNYLFFNNIDLGETGSQHRSRFENRKFLEFVWETYNFKRDLPSIRDLYKFFDDQLQYFKAYEHIISLHWKGEKRSIGDIFENLKYTVSSSLYAYALLDIYYKFAVATIHYETVIMMNDIDQYYAKYRKKIEIHRYFTHYKAFGPHFPEVFERYKSYYKYTWSHFFNSIFKISDKFPNVPFKSMLKGQLNELNVLGIFVNLEAQKIATETSSEVEASSVMGEIQSDTQQTPNVNIYIERFKKNNEDTLISVITVYKILNKLRHFYD